MASASTPADPTQPAFPSGLAVFRTVPYAFILPEIVSTASSAPAANLGTRGGPQHHPEDSQNGNSRLFS